MAEFAKNTGRISYVEPTNMFWGGSRAGTLSDSINFPYEDYGMAVELIVKTTNRYSCGLSEFTGEASEQDYSTVNGTLSLDGSPKVSQKFDERGFTTNYGTVSFFGGTKYSSNQNTNEDGFLTTNFTDISMANPETNTNECLGIESISITYNSWIYPEVTIKFTDVRGATVMQPAETAYYNEKNTGSSTPLYRSLFLFPYPIYTLKVKGFYGKGVTYRLAMLKTSFEFDANTGNFNITANFIGYMFGIFADIPMTYLAAAPFMEAGKQYWEQKVNEGIFQFRDVNGNIQSPMITFPDLKLFAAKAAMSTEAQKIAAEGQEMLNNIDTNATSLDSLIETYPFKNWYEGRDKLIIVHANADAYKNFSSVTKSYIEQLAAYDSINNTSHAKIFETIKNGAITTTLKASNVYVSNGITYFTWLTDKEKKIYREEISKYNDDKEYVLRKLTGTEKSKKTWYVTYVTKPETTDKWSDFVTTLKEEQKNLLNKKDSIEAEYMAQQELTVEKALGFRPSIKNMFDLAFAHMDTFTHCFYDTMKGIKSELEGNNDVRKKSTYNINDGDTDTENIKTKTGEDNGIERAYYLPPFAAYYEDKSDNNQNRKVLKWPGDLNGGDNLREVKFTLDLLCAAQLYEERAKEVEKQIEEMSSAAKTFPDSLDGCPTTSVIDFIPVTTFDFVNKDAAGNPYKSIKPLIVKGEEAIDGNVLGMFALRAYYYLSTNSEKHREAKTFGQIEAINLYKALGYSVSDNFINFIKKYADDENTRQEKKDFIETITTTEKTTASSVWQFDTNATQKNLFQKFGDKKLKYWLRKIHKDGSKGNFNYFPLKADDFTKIKHDLVNPVELYKNKNYLSINNPYNQYIAEYGQTFNIIENRDYVPALIANIKEEVAKTTGEINTKEEESTDLSGNTNTESTIDNSKLNVNISDSYIIEYANNIETSAMKNCRFSKDCVYKIDEDGKEDSLSEDDIKKSISGETKTEQRNYYIKYPTAVNEDTDKSLFENDLFKQQDKENINLMACMFLQAFPMYGLYTFKSYNGVIPKYELLREGCYYWWEEWRSQNTLVNPNNYNIPNSGETFYGYGFFGKDLTRAETFKIDSKYVSIEDQMPKYASSTRKIYLKKYFEKWAQDTSRTGFNGAFGLLLDSSLYNENDYNKGLNISLAAGGGSAGGSTKAKNLQYFLRDLLFTQYTVFDYYNGALCNGEDDMFVVTEDQMKEAFNSFMDGLNQIYGDVAAKSADELNAEVAALESASPFKNKDIRLSTYITLKSLYDKWLCFPYKGINTWTLSKDRESNSDFDNFIYTDSFYHDIGYRLIVNIDKLTSLLDTCLPTPQNQADKSVEVQTYTNQTLYEYLTSVAQDCNGILLAMPQKFISQDSIAIQSIFDVLPINCEWDTDSSSFVFMYRYKPSEHLGSEDTVMFDMNGWSREGDGFNLTDDEIIGSFTDDGYSVPAFGVTYAKQNQSIFKNITLNQENAGVTEPALNATFNIASKNSQGSRETNLYGQDLYEIYSQQAYKCSVECMGNMEIQPMMYFQLNNIPMWKGAYMIMKVSHNITAGNITTQFEGVRVNRYSVPLTDGVVPENKYTGREGSSYGDSYTVPNIGEVKASGDAMERGLTTARTLIKLGWPKLAAAAVAGVYIDENNCDPKSCMGAEKSNKGSSVTKNGGYGAGIASWTGVKFKNQCLKDAGLPEGSIIENLTFAQQIQMVDAMSNRSMKTYYSSLKRCKTIEDASATALIITLGVGHSKNWSTHPTPAEAKQAADEYGRKNDASYGKSDNHWNKDKRSLQYAKQLLAQI